MQNKNLYYDAKYLVKIVKNVTIGYKNLILSLVCYVQFGYNKLEVNNLCRRVVLHSRAGDVKDTAIYPVRGFLPEPTTILVKFSM
jgi:hypothetical protein